MRVWLVLLLLLAGSALAAQSREDDEIVTVSTSDPDMVAAIRKARAELDDFLKLAAAPPPGTSGFKLKAMVRDGGRTEHFWVTPFEITPTGFQGTLANEPRVVRNVRVGQLHRFTRAEISDWGYERNGRQVGSYTVCVLFKKMPKEQADYYRTNHGFDC